VEYLGLELRLLETQLDLREDPELMRQLGQRYPLDHQGRIIYPLPFRLPQQPGSDNPFFLPTSPTPTRETGPKTATGPETGVGRRSRFAAGGSPTPPAVQGGGGFRFQNRKPKKN
jgi:hypothetical protein